VGDTAYLPEQPENAYDIYTLPLQGTDYIGTYDTDGADGDGIGEYAAEDMGYDQDSAPDKPHNSFGMGVQMAPASTQEVLTDWIADTGSTLGTKWLADEDGWFYWAEPLTPGTSTGLLLDEINWDKAGNRYDSYKYAIHAEVQAVTPDELFGTGVTLGTDDAFTSSALGNSAPTANAQTLLKALNGIGAMSIVYNLTGDPVAVEDIPQNKALSVSMTDNYTFTDGNGVDWRLLWVDSNYNAVIIQDVVTETRAMGTTNTNQEAAAPLGSSLDTYLNGDYYNALDPKLQSVVINGMMSFPTTASTGLTWPGDANLSGNRKVFLIGFGEMNLPAQSQTGPLKGYVNNMSGNMYPGQLLFPTKDSAQCENTSGNNFYYLYGIAYDNNNDVVRNAIVSSASGEMAVENGTLARGIRPAMRISLASPKLFSHSKTASHAPYIITYNQTGETVELASIPKNQVLSVSPTDNYTFRDNHGVEWRFLYISEGGTKDGQAIIIKDDVTEKFVYSATYQFENSGQYHNYTGSDIQAYLEGAYKNAQDPALVSLIVPTTINESFDNGDSEIVLSNVNQHIYPLNHHEFLSNGTRIDINLISGVRLLPTADSAKCDNSINYGNGRYYYWLTGGQNLDWANGYAQVLADSATGVRNNGGSSSANIGLRPAMTINVNNDRFAWQ
jgi:hypothetical protein